MCSSRGLFFVMVFAFCLTGVAVRAEVEELEDAEALVRFLKESKHKVVLLFVHKAGCPFCARLAPKIERVAAENRRKDVFVVKIHKEKVPRLGSDYDIKLFPTVMIYKGGRVYEQGGRRSIFKGSSAKTAAFFQGEIEKVLREQVPDGERVKRKKRGG